MKQLRDDAQHPATPHVALQGRSQDPRRFPHHVEVRRYLEAYAEHFDLLRVVKLNREVVSIAPVPLPDHPSTPATATSPDNIESSGSRYSLSHHNQTVSWRVTTAETGTGGVDSAGQHTQTYDAIMICNGHYAVPRLPPVEGIDQFPGACEHSHNYRRPGPYKGLKVLVVGAHASGVQCFFCVETLRTHWDHSIRQQTTDDMRRLCALG